MSGMPLRLRPGRRASSHRGAPPLLGRKVGPEPGVGNGSHRSRPSASPCWATNDQLLATALPPF